MFQQRRPRRSFSALPSAADSQTSLRSLVTLVLIVGLIAWGAWKGLQALGWANRVQRARVDFHVLQDPVNVSIEGGDMRATTDAKLYDEDKVSSNTGGKATMAFFDGTDVRIDERTDVTVVRSGEGTKKSYVTLAVTRGGIWIETPSVEAFSGSIARTVTTPRMTALIPAGSPLVSAKPLACRYSSSRRDSST